jgi:hypothetical protein
MTERTRDCVYLTALVAVVWFWTLVLPHPYIVGATMILSAPIGVYLGYWMDDSE